MKYTSLKKDIINILHSSDSNLNLKFYDEDGNTTLDSDEASWGYIQNNNIMVEFMTDDTPVLYLWKDKENISNDMKSIIQRMRELAVLNGVSVQIRVYDNLDQRKIYNLLKSAIVKRKSDSEDEENVTESKKQEGNMIDENIINAYKNIIQTAKNTKKSTDNYMSEAIQASNSEKILKELISEVHNIKNLNKLDESIFSKLMTVTTVDEIVKLVESYSKKDKNIINENIENINNVCSFVKKEYLNNTEFSNKKINTLFVLENVKVYKANLKQNKENLVNAYNHLVESAKDAKSGLDLIRVIKKEKLLETYKVSKKELLDMWLAKNNKPIENKSAYIIESYKGEKIAFNGELGFGIKAIANYINNGGDKNSIVCKNIVMETVKYNKIASFILEYKDNYSVRKYIPKFKKIFNETVSRINSANLDFKNELFESINYNYDYEDYYNELVDTIGVTHDAIKYLALEEAKNIAEASKLLNEEKDKDATILSKELKHYSNIASVIATSIVESKINAKKPLNENSIKETASELYHSLQDKNDKISMTLSSALFNISHTNKMIMESKKPFIKTLLKYCK